MYEWDIAFILHDIFINKTLILSNFCFRLNIPSCIENSSKQSHSICHTYPNNTVVAFQTNLCFWSNQWLIDSIIKNVTLDHKTSHKGQFFLNWDLYIWIHLYKAE